MKKLLVILLLFFPVHGAWADISLTLQCKNVNSAYTVVLHFDFSSKQVFNNAGKVIGIDLHESGNIIQYRNPPGLVTDMRKRLPTFLRSETMIDRTDKGMLDNLYYSDRDIEQRFSTCKKFKAERKF